MSYGDCAVFAEHAAGHSQGHLLVSQEMQSQLWCAKGLVRHWHASVYNCLRASKKVSKQKDPHHSQKTHTSQKADDLHKNIIFQAQLV